MGVDLVPVQGGRLTPPARRVSLFGASLVLPATGWLVTFFAVPAYVVLCIAFGRIDPVLRGPLPAWNPVDWRLEQLGFVWGHLVGADGFFGPAIVRTVLYVAVAVALCLLISYPVAYYVARHAGRRRGLVLTLIVAPFWISYMMRMLAWVNLLENDGLVNQVVTLGGRADVQVDWLSGQPATVVLGLVYGYVPYMVLPMFASFDRISPSLLEAARDLGAHRFELFRRVILPMSRPGVTAGLILVALPMTGDYFTNDLLSGSPRTAMIGNLINTAVQSPGQAGQAGALLLLLVAALLLPMAWYVRSTARGELGS